MMNKTNSITEKIATISELKGRIVEEGLPSTVLTFYDVSIYQTIEKQRIFHYTLQQIKYYDKIKMNLRFLLNNADKLIKIVECESNEIARRTAFLETTIEAILSGADYSKCETIDDMANMYSYNLIKRLDL